MSANGKLKTSHGNGAIVRVKNSQSPKPIADSELISIVTANLHPSLFPHLERMDAEITTWQELHDLTLRAETIIELEHRAEKSLNRQMQVLAMDQSDDEEVEANVLTYYNCQKPGHKHSECPRPKKFFCHKCGRKGVKYLSGQECQGSSTTSLSTEEMPLFE